MKARITEKGKLIITAETGEEKMALWFWWSCQHGYAKLGENTAEQIGKVLPDLGVLQVEGIEGVG